MAADIDIRIIHQRQVKIHIHVVPDMGILPPVCPEGRLDDAIFTQISQKFLQNLLLLSAVGWPGLVVFVHQIIEPPLHFV